MALLRKKRRYGERLAIHTPSEIVHCTLDGNYLIAETKSANATKALKRKGFEPFEAEKPKPKPKAKAKPSEEGSPADQLKKKLKNKPGVEILEESVDELSSSLSKGNHDGNLQELLEEETKSKGRKTALEAIRSRISRLGL